MTAEPDARRDAVNTPDTIAGAALLRRVGEALYGPRWQSALAIDLDVSDRTMRRWVAGDQIPHGVWGELRDLVDARGIALAAIYEELDPIAGGRR